MMEFKPNEKDISPELDTKKITIVSIGVMVFFALVRIFRLGLPATAVFDEVYYPEYARNMLLGGYNFDVHPPLGKIIIAMGEWLWAKCSDNIYLGWRCMPALFGIGLIPLSFWTASQIFKNKMAAYIVALLVAVDGMFIIYSRTGLMEIFLIFFGIASVGFTWKFRNAFNADKPYRFWLSMAVLFASLALDIKWSGAAFLMLAGVTALFSFGKDGWKHFFSKHIIEVVLIFSFIPICCYVSPFVVLFPLSGFYNSLLNWHQEALNFSLQLTATHPYASKWWTWPFIIYPVWFYYKINDGYAIGINGIGNVLSWWCATVSVGYSIWLVFKRSMSYLKPAPHTDEIVISNNIKGSEYPIISYLIAGWLVCYLPWAFIGRILFLYHYLPAHVFAILLLSFYLEKQYANPKNQKRIVILLLVIVLVAVYFIPVWIGLPLPTNWMRWWIWFETWT